MQTFFRVAAIFFGLGIIGSLMDGDFHPLILVVAVICAYFGWMHEFTKKEVNEEQRNQGISKANEALKPPSERFSQAQKHALVCSLYVIAAGDDEVHPNELEYISKVVNVLEYWDFDEAKIVSNILENREMIIEIISGFNDYQRNYLMYCMDGVIKADGVIKEIELQYADSIIIQAGLNIEQFQKIVLKR